MKKLIVRLMAMPLLIGLMVLNVQAGSINDISLQIKSNQAILFINGYWVKPIYTEKSLSGFAFVPHAVAIQDKMVDILGLSERIKGLDDVAGQLSSDLLVAQSERLINPLLVIDVDSKLGNWWEGSIDDPLYGDDDYDTGIGNDGLPDDGWWNEIDDSVVFGDDPLDTNINNIYGDGLDGIDDASREWGDGTPIDDNDDGVDWGDEDDMGSSGREWGDGTLIDDGGVDWSDDENSEDENSSEREWSDGTPIEGEDNEIVGTCPPPRLCFQTEAMDAMGISPDLIWHSVNVMLNTVMSGKAQNLISYTAMEKGMANLSVANIEPF